MCTAANMGRSSVKFHFDWLTVSDKYVQATVRESERSLASLPSPTPCGDSLPTLLMNLSILCKLSWNHHLDLHSWGKLNKLQNCRFTKLLSGMITPAVWKYFAPASPHRCRVSLIFLLFFFWRLSNAHPQNIVFWRGLYCRFEVGTQPREPVIDLLTLTQLHTARYLGSSVFVL